MIINTLQYIMQKLGVNVCDNCRSIMPSSSSSIWCHSCIELIGNTPRCQRCGLETQHETDLCGACLTEPPIWDKLYCISGYTSPIKEYVNKLKYNQHFWYAQDLATLLAPKILNPAPIIYPVPLHWKRHFWRTYNQSNLLGWGLEKQMNTERKITRCDATTFQRIKRTRPQQGLSKKQRKKNLINAFQLIKPIPHQHVAIVDDVVTTGSTINQLCIELRKAGVKQIDIYALCRTKPPK